MFLVYFALKRPYTIAALMVLVCLLGGFAAHRMPTDIFPEINIPVVSVVWTYNGMSADDMQNRILTLHEKQMASLVDDIERIEANAYNGVGVIKIYLHEGADVSRAVSQLGSSAQTVLKYMPRNITPPLVLRYGATDVPIVQLSLASSSLTDTRLNDLGQNVIRPALAVVQGAQVPYPYGGKPRVVMVDLDNHALQATGLTPADVSAAITAQNVISPSGDVKMGATDYTLALNNSSDTIAAINNFPIKQAGRTTLFLRDVAYVHDGFQVQTNAVNENGRPGGLMMIRKTGGASTLDVIDAVYKALPDIRHMIPAGVDVKPIFDQSIFVRASLEGVGREGAIAAGLTGLMILLFLGSWRSTVIICISIPLSILISLICLWATHQTLNIMTLGGFALAVGILVDDATVVIENIERNLGLDRSLDDAIIEGSREIGIPALISTLSICLVFAPVFLLNGTAKYLFSPLAMAVVFAMLASYVLSRTLVPMLFRKFMRGHVHAHGHASHGADDIPHPVRSRNPFSRIHLAFESAFDAFREHYRNALAWAVDRPLVTVLFFVALFGSAALLFTRLGMNFFPSVDAGQMRLHVRAPAGTKLEQTQAYFARVERTIRRIVGDRDVDVLIDNVGLPYSGINIALSDSATVGPMDGEILVSLKEGHRPTAGYMATLRRELPREFPECKFFFQPADIVNQVLNFGQAAPIDVRIAGPHEEANYATARKVLADLKKVPGVVDAHIFQVPDAPAMNIDVDRTLASEMGMTQRDVADNVLVALSSSAMVAPNFWLNPETLISYPLIVQTPTYRVGNLPELVSMPLAGHAAATDKQLLMGVADVTRTKAALVKSQVNIRPVFDVHADVQGTDLGAVAKALDDIMRRDQPEAKTAIHITAAGQIQTMRESFIGLAGGIGFAVLLVYLLLVMNFQSWKDPAIVLLAVPLALSGVVWMLYACGTPISVPALMGTLMCIGLTTANSTLVVSFANERMEAGDDALTAAIAAGYTRLRPVLMTAGAMILGMVPMALGLGEGAEQNVPLGRAVIGGLLCATFATLVFVPTMYRLIRGNSPAAVEAV
jgi:multidrug efflux pump subunit AcrB